MSVPSFSLRTLAGVLAAGAVVLATTGPAGAAADGATSRPADDGLHAVFVGTNHNNTTDPAEPANQVVMYRRAADGTLTLVHRYDTGGQGSGPGQRFAGDGLGAGNSLRLSGDRRWLFAANAGSGDLSVFRVTATGLELTDRVPTGDGSPGLRFPNSVTEHDGVVYVLNAADGGSVTGFRLTPPGRLHPIAGSTRMLDANQTRFAPDALYDPAQVAFTPDGRHLVVSIKDGPDPALAPGTQPTGPGRVLVFAVGRDGRPSAAFTRTDFAHRGPFGFSFDGKGNLLVAQFVGGGVESVNGAPTLTGAAGSYRIEADGRLTAITAAEPDHQVDTCWLVNNGRYAYGSNYTSGTVSSFTVGADGSLRLLEAVAGTTEPTGTVQGSTPLDERVSPDGSSLYVVLPGAGKVGAWHIGRDGRLRKLGEYAGLPRTVDGDMAPVDFGAGGSPAGIEVL